MLLDGVARAVIKYNFKVLFCGHGEGRSSRDHSRLIEDSATETSVYLSAMLADW